MARRYRLCSRSSPDIDWLVESVAMEHFKSMHVFTNDFKLQNKVDFSSALPLQSNLLGLTTLTLPSILETSHSSSSTTCGKHYQTSCSRLALVGPHECPKFTTYPAHPETKPSDTIRTLSQVRSDSPTSWPFWQVFIPFSYHPSTASHRELLSPTSLASSYVTHPDPTGQVALDEQSVWSQLMSRAFGVSTPSTTSYGLLLIILLYNLCFLTTSVWFAGRRLGGATLSFSLEIITSLQCVHQHQLRGNGTRSLNHNVDLSAGGVHFSLPTERLD
ncbi:uncharacterized protein DEA37_0003297 [Paragonimus westermani]|uniref:Uncharacterized protein n=1 Tax=Paragonimus westermani TaxID=34504 RepID=A0A5J4NAL1_9TREM|nr:uncharacterized protein DEA37_0003297 [Paragonimus westermani]